MEKAFCLLLLWIGTTSAGDKCCSKLKFSGHADMEDMMGEYVKNGDDWYEPAGYEHQGKRLRYNMYRKESRSEQPQWVIRYVLGKDHILARSLDTALEPEMIKAPWKERSRGGRWKTIPDWKIQCQDEEEEVEGSVSWKKPLLVGLMILFAALIIIITVCGVIIYKKKKTILKTAPMPKDTDPPPPYWINCEAESLPEKVIPDIIDNPAACDVTHEPPSAPPRYEDI